MADVIQEFLIGIGYKVDRTPLDEASKAAKERADEDAKQAAEFRQKWGGAIKSVATALATLTVGLVGFVERTSASTAELDTWASKIGTSTQALQRLEFAGAKFGASSDHVREAVKTLRENLGELARVGSGPAVDSLATLGLTLGDINGLDAEAQIALLADRLRTLPDQAQRVSVALELMGEDGGALLPLFAEGSDAITKYGKEAEQLGAVFSKDAVKGSVDFQRSLQSTKAELSAAAQQIGADFMPVVRQLIEVVSDVVKWFGASEHAAVRAVPAIVALGVAVHAMAGPWGLAAAGIALVISQLGTMQDAVTDAIGAISGLNDELERLNEINGGTTKLRGNAALVQGDVRAGRLASARRGIARLSDDDLATIASKGDAKTKQLAQREIAERANKANRDAQLAGSMQGARDRALISRGDELSRQEERRKRKKKGKASTPDEVVFLDAYDEQAQALFGADIDRWAERTGATEQARQNAMTAAAASLRSGNLERVAREAAMGSISGSTGIDLKPSNDRILSELTGDAGQPDIRLAELTKDTTPQVLNSVVNNTFTTQVEIQVDGAGDPDAVAARVGDEFETRWAEKLNQTSKFVKILFDS